MATPRELIDSLGVSVPADQEFDRVADLTALRRDATGGVYRSNDARGPLLYALVAARRPQRVLEFGTGRGYGALCMAWAMAVHGISGTISTIDLVPQRRSFDWLYRDERGVHEEPSSRESFWRSRFPRAWLERIVPLEGRSASVVERLRRDETGFDLAFVDGGHDRATAGHDLLAAAG
ncbi:MAG: class I SAM-dependent methyltransferase, partial [Chloroflexi bacterium]|nr:class I SAM-dependent methyltransferase [Chloroflexota bacterium]